MTLRYIATGDGRRYLAAVLNGCSRRLLGWAVGERMGSALFCEALERARRERGQVRGVIIHTDGWKSRDGLVLGGSKHHRIHHPQNQFARGKNHVNGIESFWSFTKLRGIRAEYFFLHLKASEWRWNHRPDNLYLFFLKNLRSEPLYSYQGSGKKSREREERCFLHRK